MSQTKTTTDNWATADRLAVTALLNDEVDGQPWPVLMTQGNLHYFANGTDDECLRCIPVEWRGDHIDPADTGGVDYDYIEPELADCCRAIAGLLRAQIAFDPDAARIPDFDREKGRDLS